MARMKIEVQAARLAKHGLSLHDRLVGYLPRYAPYAAKFPQLANLRNEQPWLARWMETFAGLSTRRSLPRWRSDWFRDSAGSDDVAIVTSTQISPGPARVLAWSIPPPPGPGEEREVVLFADTFNRYFERETIEAAIGVLRAAGCRVHLPRALGGRRPLCCGRTFLAV